MTPITGGNNIKGIGYEPETKRLHIEFTGGTYVFDDVPPALYEALMKSDSKGTFFHSNIKGRHQHQKVHPEAKA